MEEIKRTEIASLGEFGLIERLTGHIQLKNTSTLKGVGDDSAVLDYRGKQTLITTDLLLDKAEEPGDYATVASMIYSDVEDNLISKFGVPHREKSFYMTQSEYVALKNTYLNSWHIPREVRFRNDPEVYVEMPVEIRFAKAGFSASEAKEAAANWSALNMMRHRSPENRQRLDSFLSSCGMDEKDFLRSVLKTFREKGVYTRD